MSSQSFKVLFNLSYILVDGFACSPFGKHPSPAVCILHLHLGAGRECGPTFSSWGRGEESEKNIFTFGSLKSSQEVREWKGSFMGTLWIAAAAQDREKRITVVEEAGRRELADWTLELQKSNPSSSELLFPPTSGSPAAAWEHSFAALKKPKVSTKHFSSSYHLSRASCASVSLLSRHSNSCQPAECSVFCYQLLSFFSGSIFLLDHLTRHWAEQIYD